jgi:hypothetical protein
LWSARAPPEKTIMPPASKAKATDSHVRQRRGDFRDFNMVPVSCLAAACDGMKKADIPGVQTVRPAGGFGR